MTDQPASTLNPFAPPKADLEAQMVTPDGAPEGVWSDGKFVVMRVEGVRLPNRCIKCNSENPELTKTKKLYWHSPFIYLLFFVYVIAYVIVAVIVRKRATVTYSMCKRCRNKRRMVLLAGAVPFFAIVLLGATIMQPTGPFVAVGALAFLAMVLTAAFVVQVLSPRKIGKQYAKIAGVHPDLLKTLPPVTAGIEV